MITFEKQINSETMKINRNSRNIYSAIPNLVFFNKIVIKIANTNRFTYLICCVAYETGVERFCSTRR